MGMSKYDRLLHILNLLRSRRTLNARRLAEECQVTERSIYRDLITLSEANVPIYYDKGYKLASGNFLPPLNFTAEEYACLQLALESSPLAKAGRKADTIRQIKAKIDCSLSDSTKEQNRILTPAPHIEIDTTIADRGATKYYGALEQAVSEQVSVELEYDSIEHGTTQREVEPYFIVFRRHAFYFVGYCHLRGDFRTFRIDRVRNLKPTGRKFARKREMTAATYFEGSWGVYQGRPVEVTVDFSSRAARVVAGSRHHPKESIERLGPDLVRYRVTVPGTEEIKRWILGFGTEAEVIGPEELRAELARVAKQLASVYRDGPTEKSKG